MSLEEQFSVIVEEDFLTWDHPEYPMCTGVKKDGTRCQKKVLMNRPGMQAVDVQHFSDGRTRVEDLDYYIVKDETTAEKLRQQRCWSHLDQYNYFCDPEYHLTIMSV